jgi:hypothetical protein
MRLPLATVFLLALSAPLAACVTDDPALPEPPVVDSGRYHHYVQTGWTLPATSSEAYQLAFDLDGDGSGDNNAGNIIGALAGLGLDASGTSAGAFARGDVVILHSVRADDLVDDGAVSWRVLAGEADAPPRFDGTDVLRAGSDDGWLLGPLVQGRADLSWGGVTLALPFFPDQPPLELPLVEARLAATITASGCSGRVGGVMLNADIETTLPRFAAQAIVHIERNPTNRFAEAAHNIFDEDRDGTITVDEIVTSSLTRSAFRPDVDLDGDGDPDGLSFGLGLECVPATFSAPGEV